MGSSTKNNESEIAMNPVLVKGTPEWNRMIKNLDDFDSMSSEEQEQHLAELNQRRQLALKSARVWATREQVDHYMKKVVGKETA